MRQQRGELLEPLHALGGHFQAQAEALDVWSLEAREAVWSDGAGPGGPVQCVAQVRAHGGLAPATAHPVGRDLRVELDEPLLEGCPCPACEAGYSRGYLHYLIKGREQGLSVAGQRMQLMLRQVAHEQRM